MNDLAEYLADPQSGHWHWAQQHLGVEATTLILMLVVGLALLLGFFMPVAGFITYVERKIAGFTQSRIGPNRVGPFGLLQFVADGIKLVIKEDITPAAVDVILFRLAPYAVLGGAFMVLVVLPLGPNLIAADMPLGLLIYLAGSSFVTMGIVMSGWASNNKWSTMGAARSVAQIVSYEIPVGLSLLPLVLLAGSLSFQDFAKLQGAYPWQWNAFHNPGLFLCAFCYFIAALAEINRTPFDIPEAESELVSGYNTEYSGMRFGMFFMAEFGNVMVISLIAAVCFWGGWHFPGENWLATRWFGGAHPVLSCGVPAAAACYGALETHTLLPFVVFNALGALVLTAKGFFGVVVIVLFRWTLPRVRVDQLMNLCWKYLVPMSLFGSFVTAAWMLVPLWFPSFTNWNYHAGDSITHGNWPMFVAGMALILGWGTYAWSTSKHDRTFAHRRKDATAGRAVWEGPAPVRPTPHAHPNSHEAAHG